MKKTTLILITLLTVAGSVFAQKDTSGLKTAITSNFPDNVAGFITPERLRNVSLDLMRSNVNKLEDNVISGKLEISDSVKTLDAFYTWNGSAWVEVGSDPSVWSRSGGFILPSTYTDKLSVDSARFGGVIYPLDGTVNIGTSTAPFDTVFADVIDGLSSAWIESVDSLYVTSKNVGIGTSSPTAKLDVRGDVNLSNDTTIIKVGRVSGLLGGSIPYTFDGVSATHKYNTGLDTSLILEMGKTSIPSFAFEETKWILGSIISSNGKYGGSISGVFGSGVIIDSDYNPNLGEQPTTIQVSNTAVSVFLKNNPSTEFEITDDIGRYPLRITQTDSIFHIDRYKLKYTDFAGTEGEGKVLTSDASGIASWAVNKGGCENDSLVFDMGGSNLVYYGCLSLRQDSLIYGVADSVLFDGMNIGYEFAEYFIGSPYYSQGITINNKGEIKILDANEDPTGAVLTSDADGKAIWSDLSAWGEMGFADSSHTLALTQNVPAWVTNTGNDIWSVASVTMRNVTYSGDSLIINSGGSGTYFMSGHLSVEGLNGSAIKAYTYLNGSVACSCVAVETLENNDIVTVDIACDILPLSEGDVLTVWVENTANNDDVDLISGKFTIHKIGQ